MGLESPKAPPARRCSYCHGFLTGGVWEAQVNGVKLEACSNDHILEAVKAARDQAGIEHQDIACPVCGVDVDGFQARCSEVSKQTGKTIVACSPWHLGLALRNHENHPDDGTATVILDAPIDVTTLSDSVKKWVSGLQKPKVYPLVASGYSAYDPAWNNEAVLVPAPRATRQVIEPKKPEPEPVLADGKTRLIDLE
jgi:hypothetical protein